MRQHFLFLPAAGVINFSLKHTKYKPKRKWPILHYACSGPGQPPPLGGKFRVPNVLHDFAGFLGFVPAHEQLFHFKHIDTCQNLENHMLLGCWCLPSLATGQLQLCDIVTRVLQLNIINY